MTDLALVILATLCKFFEGLEKRLNNGMIGKYLCPANYWTQGYGILCNPDAPDITPAEAERRLYAALPMYVKQTLACCPRLWLGPPERLAAIADFTFNLGAARLRASTLRRKINAGDWDDACVELMKWVNGGGRRLPGLVARRAAEIKLIRKIA